MATELGKAYVQIVPSAKGISGSITKELKGESKSAGKSAGSTIVSTMKKVFVAAGIGKALMSAVQEGGDLEQSLGGIETLFKDNADTVKKYAQEAYKTAGLGANEYMESVTGFSASLLQSLGGDTEKAAEISNMAMIDMADNSNKMGSSMESIQNAYSGFAKQNYTMLDNLKLGYGGTKTEMERLLADAQELTGVEYNINNLSDVYEAIHAVQEEIGITGTTALEAEETIQGSFASMKGAFQNVLGSLALGENIKPSMEGMAQSISTFLFGNLFPMIGTILQSLPSALVTFIQAMIPELMEMGSNLLSSISDGISGGLPTILQKGVDIVLNIGNGMMEKAPTVLNNIGDILTNIFNALVEAIPTILSKGIELITGLSKGLIQNAPAVMESITNILSKLVNAIVEKSPEMLKKGLELIKNLATGLLNNLPEVISSISKILSNLLSKIVEHLPQLLKTGVKLIAQLAAGLIKAIPDIVKKIPEIIQAIVKAIAGLGGQLVDAGKDLMGGLAKGIGDSIGAVVTKAKEAAGEVVGSVKGFFGINSPSRVFMGIGEFLNLGLAKGIEDNMSPVTNAMDNLESVTTRELTKDISLNNSISSQIGSSAYKNNSNETDSMDEANKDTNITVITQLDGKVVAKTTSRVQAQTNRGKSRALGVVPIG